MSKANDRQVGGNHYRAVEGEQHWDRAARLQWDIFQYQVTKYVERWKRKGGAQDLKKALHFLEKYIELVDQGVYRAEPPGQEEVRDALFRSQGVPPHVFRGMDSPLVGPESGQYDRASRRVMAEVERKLLFGDWDELFVVMVSPAHMR
jgi:hypothetical protein